MEGRESRLNAHINPTIGEVPVVKWRVEHSRAVMEKGRRTLFSQRGREDLRGQLSALRKLAWRLGWLDRSVDPLDGLEIGRANVLHDATAQYVDPRLRPETRQVRAVVKNHVVHEVPLPRSLMHEELLPRVKELLGLPAKPEMHNERWHRVRKWVEENDPDDAWPKTIVYRSLRHHAATKWFHDELGESWDVVAQYLGDKLTTVLNHYVRAGEDALRDSVSKLADR